MRSRVSGLVQRRCLYTGTSYASSLSQKKKKLCFLTEFSLLRNAECFVCGASWALFLCSTTQIFPRYLRKKRATNENTKEQKKEVQKQETDKFGHKWKR